jgi:hypothetical protein
MLPGVVVAGAAVVVVVDESSPPHAANRATALTARSADRKVRFMSGVLSVVIGVQGAMTSSRSPSVERRADPRYGD